MARFRFQASTIDGGKALNVGTSTYEERPNVNLVYEECTDETLDGDCHPLDVKRYSHSGPKLNCPQLSRHLVNWVPDQFYAGYNYGVPESLPQEPSDSLAATQGAARTNPSRPYVDVPAQVFELADVTVHLRNTIYNGLLKCIAQNNLRYWFAVAPAVSDLFKLVNFYDQVNRRVEVIKKLTTARGYRRTVNVFDSSNSKVISKLLNNRNDVITLPNVTMQTTKKVSVHCRWKAVPNARLYRLGDDDYRIRVAKHAVLGLSQPLSVDFLRSAWEGVPFSWLIDWGVNIGDYLNSQSNIIPATLAECTVQRLTHVFLNFPAGFTSGRGTVVPPCSWNSQRKTRARHMPTITAHFPFLDEKKLGLLGSLAVLRT